MRCVQLTAASCLPFLLHLSISDCYVAKLAAHRATRMAHSGGGGGWAHRNSTSTYNQFVGGVVPIIGGRAQRIGDQRASEAGLAAPAIRFAFGRISC